MNDASLLHSGRLIVRDDLASNPLVLMAKNAYEGLLSGYWRLLCATVLRG